MRVAAVAAVAAALIWTSAARAADGAKVFDGICQACHAEGAVGTPGLAPPLVSPVIANAATKQKDYPAMVVLNGLTGSIPLAGGGTLSSAMPPAQGLSDDDVAAVVSYLYRLNHTKTVIKAADVARVRAQPVSGDELKRIRSDLMQ